MVVLFIYGCPLDKTSLNYVGPVYVDFSINTLEDFFGDCNNLKKLTDELNSLKVQKKLKRLF